MAWPKGKERGTKTGGRTAGTPNVRTQILAQRFSVINDQGLAGFDLKAWYGVMAPANLPPGVAEKLNAEITKALKNPEMHEKLMAMGQEPIALGLAESDAYVKREIARWADVVKLSGAKAD